MRFAALGLTLQTAFQGENPAFTEKAAFSNCFNFTCLREPAHLHQQVSANAGKEMVAR